MNQSGSNARPFEGQLEHLEERLAFTASPLTAMVGARVESAIEVAPQDSSGGQAAGDSASNDARERYGLDGTGQTVVIIDSGIAYDHYALGGGLGSSYRVVGGWDFAEDDADPYDDGAAGFHGTHVAGIVGSSDADYTGLAPGVDLVGLRVFDDQGGGSFEWIESALAWVHSHRNAFENPITTVNMSIGADWNAQDVPDWEMLENELQQLENDGIFVSVSAGNNFATEQTVGLNYPASSPFVIPVASVGSDGTLSSFSQRNQRVLAAPGEDITSTAPDYLYGFDGVTDDFVSASGTSMAAPYVAGASTLLRQAMEAMGHPNINQDRIANILRATADSVHDPITNASYDRINLQRALDSIVGADDYGSTAESAYQVAPSEDYYSISGAIHSTADQDHFRYVAQDSGELTIDMLWYSAADSSPSLSINGQLQGDNSSIDVVAGQTYSFAVMAGNRIGRYSAGLTFTAEEVVTRSAAAPSATAASRMTWTAATDGTYEFSLTIENAQSASRLEIRNGQGQFVAALNSPRSHESFSIDASAGEQFQIDLVGRSASAELVVSETSTSNGGSPGTSSNSISFGASFRIDTRLEASVDDVLVEFGPIEETAPEEVDAAILGWQRFSEWLDTMANSKTVASDVEMDEPNESDQGSLEIFSLTLDEAFCDDDCWRR